MGAPMKRKILACVVALGLAPGTLVRSEPPPPDYTSPVKMTSMAVDRLETGPLTLSGAWVLSSENDHFGGFSSLVVRPSGEFLSASDSGRLMAFPRPDIGGGEITLEPFLSSREIDKMAVDVESLAIDPVTGDLWAGVEWAQEIMALGSQLRRRDAVRPEEMKDWGGNSGPEAMVRLADGRFVVIEERASSAGLHRALLFPRDPVEGDRPIGFTFRGREDYRPSDAALLPDGRFDVLLRGVAWDLPLRFPSLIVIATPEDIGEGETLDSKLLAPVDAPLPNDNFEGMAVIEDRPGQWDFWLISDDNFASYQRTILIKLRWDFAGERERQKARR